MACLALGTPQVHAAAFQVREDSAVAVGTAFAGSGSAADTPSTAFNNPAGMTQLPGLQVQLGGSVVAPQAVFHGGSVSALGRPNTGFDNRDGGNAAFVPHGFVTYKATPDLAFGLAVTSPFGLSTSYGPNFIGRYQADKTDLETVNVNPAIAYQVTSWLSLGGGLSAQYGRAEFSNFLNSATLAYAATGRPASLPDGYFRLRGDNWSFGYNAGALIRPGPQTSIGVTYRSRIQQDFAGTASFTVPAPLSASPLFRSSAGSVKVVLPDTATISLTQGLGARWTAYAEVSWTNWSQFKNLNAFRNDGTLISSTPERYHNSPFAALGASYKVSEQVALRAGTAFDKSPVSNAYRTARIPDQDRVWLAIGASWQILPQLALDVGYAHIFVNNGRVSETSATGDVLSGTYSNSLDIGSVGTRLRF